MSSTILKIAVGVKVKKQNNTKIGVGSAVKAKVGESEKITREGINRRMRKEVVVCLQTVVGEKKSIVKLVMFRRKISSYSLVFLSLKYEVEMDESLSHYPEKEQGELLTIVEDP